MPMCYWLCLCSSVCICYNVLFKKRFFLVFEFFTEMVVDWWLDHNFIFCLVFIGIVSMHNCRLTKITHIFYIFRWHSIKYQCRIADRLTEIM